MHLVVVAALIRDGHGRYLCHQRPTGSWGAGRWEFPGGKVEQQEDPRDALRRECREELGVEVRAESAAEILSHRYEDLGSVILLFFHCAIISGTPEPLTGGALEWLAPGTMIEYDFLEADRPLLALLHERR